MSLPRIALALALCTTPLLAAGEDLLQIYREAVLQDPTLAAARAVWLATQERLPQARSALLPQVAASAAANATAAAADTFNGFNTSARSEFINLNGAVSASQPLYRPQSRIAVEQAVQQVDQSGLTLSSSQQDLIVRVAQAYFDILLARDNIALVEAQKVATAELLAQAKRNFEVGTATITDTNEAQARYDQILAQEIAYRADYDIRRATLQSIIGRLPAELQPLGSRFEEAKLPEDIAPVEDWMRRAQDNNYLVRSSRAAYDIATLEVERNRAARDPTVDLIGSLSFGYNSGTLATFVDTSTRQALIGVQLAVPLYTGGLIDSRVREAIANRDRARQDYESARRSATFAAQQAYLGVTQGAASVRAFQQALVSADTALASNRLGREVGVRTNLDVLNVEANVYQVRRDLAQVRYIFLMAVIRLWAAAGELDEAKLERINLFLG